ncbi:mediator of RNA polymerase II transcription subunit 21 [Elysia marginata]|uniref:Mediator of RNA polymerase II transcription subunit 21 n=1 Tax=Elysia marginata TaxID=1093978 RepID=A0AAV4GAQ7_9GAST|nr:mediator of RNA polymerase II transcription subunit 21 [Elysia marginata]
MADRLTQLQDAVTQQAEHFYNSIGILQQCAPPSPFTGFEKPGGKPASPPPQEVSFQRPHVLFCMLVLVSYSSTSSSSSGSSSRHIVAVVVAVVQSNLP